MVYKGEQNMEKQNSEETPRKKQRKRRRKTKRIIQKCLIFGLPLFFIIILVIILFSCSKNTEKNKEPEAQEVLNPIVITEEEPEEPTVVTASILSAGDVILHSPFLSSRIYHLADGTYDYNPIFSYIKPEYEAADFSITNLELTISDGNYSGYPAFRSPATIATALKQNAVDMCLLANNHIYDNGDRGLTLTMDALDANSLLYTGVRRSVADKTYYVQDINGIKVGIFNYVYQTGALSGSNISINANPVSSASAPLINTFHYQDLNTLYEEIRTGLQEMATAGVEYTIAYIHWGNEYQTQENTYQNTIAQQFCELGIDALIGGHPHVVQPVDLLTNAAGDHQMLCVYSLGNHLSNQNRLYMDSMPTGHTEDGLMVKLTLEKVDDGPVMLKTADFIPTWVYHTRKNGGSEYYILPLNNPEQIKESTTSLDKAAVGIDESLNRTNAIIGAGVEKIHSALPLQ